MSNDANNNHTTDLSPENQAFLTARGITPETVKRRGYRTETRKRELSRHGFSYSQGLSPGILIPIYDSNGIEVSHQFRSNAPRMKNGRPIEIETPKGSRAIVDVPPGVRQELLGSQCPLFIVEDVLNADAAASKQICCIAALSLYGASTDEELWSKIPVANRDVYVILDAGFKHKSRLFGRLVARLRQSQARVHRVVLPPGIGGLGALLASGQSVADIIALAQADWPEEVSPVPTLPPPKYEADETGIYRIRPTKQGDERVQLSNFMARIIAVTKFDPESHLPLELTIKATLGDRLCEFTLNATEFSKAAAWSISELGPAAIIYAGFGREAEVAVAIQSLSTSIEEFRGVTRLGWHSVDGNWVFVHADGFIEGEPLPNPDLAGENRDDPKPSPPRDLRDDVPKTPISPKQHVLHKLKARLHEALHAYSLPDPQQIKDLPFHIRGGLRFLDVAPDTITFPLYAAIWHTVVFDTDFSLHLYGTTGVGKSELASLVAQHFGAGLDSRHLTASWQSTANFLLALATGANNVMLVVDDLVLTGSQADIDRTSRAAENLFRAQGNNSPRGRCNRDGSARNVASPHCTILSTGEVRPQGQSVNNRIINIAVNEGDVFDIDSKQSQLLSDLQVKARSGVFSRVTAAFIQWCAPALDNLRRIMLEKADEYGKMLAGNAKKAHSRTIRAAASLVVGFDAFTFFCEKVVGAIDESTSANLFDRMWQAASAIVDEQVEQSAGDNPAERFISAILSALATKRAHLTYMQDEEKEYRLDKPHLWGYEAVEIAVQSKKDPLKPAVKADGSEDNDPADFETTTKYFPKGSGIGWKSYDNVYLEPQAALAMAQGLLHSSGQQPIPLEHKALGKRLRDSGLLITHSSDRNVSLVYIEGVKRSVFHFYTHDLLEFRDEHEDFELEFLSEHEAAERRREQREKIRDLRRRQSWEIRQERLMRLLDLDQ